MSPRVERVFKELVGNGHDQITSAILTLATVVDWGLHDEDGESILGQMQSDLCCMDRTLGEIKESIQGEAG